MKEGILTISKKIPIFISYNYFNDKIFGIRIYKRYFYIKDLRFNQKMFSERYNYTKTYTIKNILFGIRKIPR